MQNAAPERDAATNGGRGFLDHSTFPSENLRDRAPLATDLACLWLTAGNMNDDAAAGAARRQLSEQQRAAQLLRALVKPYRFRVRADAEGFPIIPGRYGQIEWFDGRDLAVYTDRPRLFAKLWAIPHVRRHQTGDTEMRAVFSPEAIEQVAAVVKARRRRTLASDEAHRLGANTAYRATSDG